MFGLHLRCAQAVGADKGLFKLFQHPPRLRMPTGITGRQCVGHWYCRPATPTRLERPSYNRTNSKPCMRFSSMARLVLGSMAWHGFLSLCTASLRQAQHMLYVCAHTVAAENTTRVIRCRTYLLSIRFGHCLDFGCEPLDSFVDDTALLFVALHCLYGTVQYLRQSQNLLYNLHGTPLTQLLQIPDELNLVAHCTIRSIPTEWAKFCGVGVQVGHTLARNTRNAVPRKPSVRAAFGGFRARRYMNCMHERQRTVSQNMLDLVKLEPKSKPEVQVCRNPEE